MTFNEIFEQISNESGLEYKHCTVEGRIKDICDFYGVDTRGKTLTMALRELLQIKDTSCNLYSFLLTQLMNLVVTKWYDIVIDESPEVVNTADGQLKVVQVMGNCYQAEETNLVPTPDRPIPIISKKVKAGDSYVELRSLKESKNLFDKNLLGGNATQKDSPTIQLKDKETYTISCSKNGAEYILGVRAKQKSDGGDAEIKVLRGTTEQGSFTVDYTTYESYFVRIYQNATDIIDTVQLELGSSATSYVPPTVRDYKIVDHTTKTSKIVRNVKNIDLSSIGYQYQTGIDDKPYRVANYVYNLTSIQGSYKYIYANSEKVYSYNGFQSQMENGLCVSEHGIMRIVNGVTNEDELKTYVDNNRVDILYALATPTEESIPYVETDESDYGVSFQDTTSPSPDIPSEIYEVDEINIKTVGKNIFNPNSTNITSTEVYSAIIVNPLNAQITVSITDNDTSVDVTGISLGVSGSTEYFDALTFMITSNANVRTKTTNLKCITYYPKTQETLQKLLQRFKIQIEYGSVATTYNPYQETSIQHTLSKPLRATKDGSVRDVIDVVKGKAIYKMVDLPKEYITVFSVYKKRTNTITFIIYNQNISHPTKTGVVDAHINCNVFNAKMYNNDLDEEYICLYSEHPACLFLTINKKRLDVSGDEEINILKQKCQEYINSLDIEISYETSNPIIEPLEAELVQKLKQLKTFSPVTYIWVEGLQPIINAQVKLEVYDRTKLKGGG